MNDDIQAYHDKLVPTDKAVCDMLRQEIDLHLPEATSKVWHGHPVWFLEDNPIVGYSKQKASINLLFWSGQSFDEPGLASEGSYKAAEVKFTEASQIDTHALARWLEKSARIQWDYKNIVKRKGALERLK